jgi:hypothetical protein
MATDLILKPIGLRLSINPSDWAAPNWKPPANLPAQMNIQPNDSPDGFEFRWGKDGKSKLFFVKTNRLTPRKKYVATDLSQYEAELGQDGVDSNAPGQKEITTFLGYTCYKQTAEMPSTQNLPKMNVLIYVFYARELRYIITAITCGTDPIPEKDPVFKRLLDSLTFIP